MTTKKLAFTLAEIMIVLTIIGILTAILLPIAINSAPDENVMKFKKGNNTLGTVIRELVNSDQYYLNGDLGTKANGALLDGTHDGDYTYFCETFADILSVKKNNCSIELDDYRSYLDLWNFTEERLSLMEKRADEGCAAIKKDGGITTTDDITYYEVSNKTMFGITIGQLHSMMGDSISDDRREFGGYFPDPNNPTIDPIYKVFCMDIDGINKGEDPFGYGIRVDGKIFLGARAQEWLKKSIQKGE